MAKSDFLPKRDSNLDSFEGNFIEKLTVHSSQLGLESSVVTEITEKINNHRASYSKMISKRAMSKSAREINLAQKKSTVREIRRVAQMVKSLAGYTPAIGNDLQVIGTEITKTDITELKPSLVSKVNGNEVIIKFKKSGTDGIKIFSRRGNETDFKLLEITTISPYIDNRHKLDQSKPEQREYYAVFFDNVREVGIRSDIIKAVVS